MFAEIKAATLIPAIKPLVNGFRHFTLGIKGALNNEQKVSPDEEIAKLTQEILIPKVEEVYKDINSMTSAFTDCVEKNVASFRDDLAELELQMRSDFKGRDFKNQFSMLY